MNTARIVVPTIAIGAGGIAAYLARGSDNKPTGPVAQLQAVDVLVANSAIELKSDDEPPKRGKSSKVVRYDIVSPQTMQK